MKTTMEMPFDYAVDNSSWIRGTFKLSEILASQGNCLVRVRLAGT
jgi:hypothetical protein